MYILLRRSSLQCEYVSQYVIHFQIHFDSMQYLLHELLFGAHRLSTLLDSSGPSVVGSTFASGGSHDPIAHALVGPSIHLIDEMNPSDTGGGVTSATAAQISNSGTVNMPYVRY